MHHIIFEENEKYNTAILIKEAAFNKDKLEEHYINKTDIAKKDIIAFTLKYNEKGKAPAKESKEYLQTLLKALKSLGTTTLLVCDSPYFKFLTGARKVDGAYGYIKKCSIKGFEDMDVILTMNYQSLFYNPDNQTNLGLGVKTLNDHVTGIHIDIGSDIIHSSQYPETLEDIKLFLDSLHQYPELTCDIEAFGLKHYETGIGTIGFAWDQHNGGAFAVDYKEFTHGKGSRIGDNGIEYFGENSHNPEVKKLLKTFFSSYKGKLIYHNANYDIKIIVNDLFMNNLLDQKGMIDGINTMTRNMGDTKLITYLATNSCAGNKLRLKYQAHEFAGDYAEEVEDITKIPLQDLLKYNLTDCLCTWYVNNKHLPTMIEDKQENIYNTILIPSVKSILQMELTGVPIDVDQVDESETQLLEIQAYAIKELINDPNIIAAETLLKERFLIKDFNDRKNKAKNPDKIKPKKLEDIKRKFNVGSPKQLSVLLYDILELPILDRTDTKEPATGAKTLEKLINYANDPAIKKLLACIIEYSQAAKITSTFIKAFKENSVLKDDGIWYLHGGYNLGGTVSGRLSSSGPNLQNIPSGSTYAKLIKKCFISPKGWLMAGADFDSLEDKISALTTKDPNKLKVYTDGYCGHCLRAHFYFGTEMIGIDDTVKGINSIKSKYPKLRQKSKIPTFALTYGGTYHAIMDQTGLSKEEAMAIERNYHKLYAVADEWTKTKLEEASNLGYITGAFGLRVRTPILKQTLLGKSSTPYEAQAESRTAGNALGQSYGLLNNRAGIEFQEKVLASKFWADIKPIMQIHDALYFIIRNRLDVVKWFNDNLPKCMAWQKLSELHHDKVKLSGGVELFYPNWSVVTDLPNNATKQDIINICRSSL